MLVFLLIILMKQPHQYGCKNVAALARISCRRYNISFSIPKQPNGLQDCLNKQQMNKESQTLMRQTHRSGSDILVSQKQTVTKLKQSKNPSNNSIMNRTYSKYSYFPSSCTSSSNIKKFQSCAQVGQFSNNPNYCNRPRNSNREQDIKWIGGSDTTDNPEDQSVSWKNCFPQRKKKTGKQALINMIYKYDRHYGKEASGQPEQIISNEKQKDSFKFNFKKPKKTPTLAKWFRSNKQKFSDNTSK